MNAWSTFAGWPSRSCNGPRWWPPSPGWNDAGDAASNAVRHLIEGWGAQVLAEIDPEEFTDFATVRPHVRLTDGRTRSIVWPTVGRVERLDPRR